MVIIITTVFTIDIFLNVIHHHYNQHYPHNLELVINEREDTNAGELIP